MSRSIRLPVLIGVAVLAPQAAIAEGGDALVGGMEDLVGFLIEAGLMILVGVCTATWAVRLFVTISKRERRFGTGSWLPPVLIALVVGGVLLRESDSPRVALEMLELFAEVAAGAMILNLGIQCLVDSWDDARRFPKRVAVWIWVATAIAGLVGADVYRRMQEPRMSPAQFVDLVAFPAAVVAVLLLIVRGLVWLFVRPRPRKTLLPLDDLPPPLDAHSRS